MPVYAYTARMQGPDTPREYVWVGWALAAFCLIVPFSCAYGEISKSLAPRPKPAVASISESTPEPKKPEVVFVYDQSPPTLPEGPAPPTDTGQSASIEGDGGQPIKSGGSPWATAPSTCAPTCVTATLSAATTVTIGDS